MAEGEKRHHLGLSYAPQGDALATLHKPDRGNISVYAAIGIIMMSLKAD